MPRAPFDTVQSSTVALELERTFAASTFRMVVIEGPDTGKEFVLDGDTTLRMVIGTSPACDARLSDHSVSRRHASVELTGRR
ncbi:MAG TPA: FHA domain-containing protein, partial [Polyangiaceae bacterium]|nr:FHA domain-containing protein [Polyangiaceae bacterium]